ncbi:TetR/AcrR family transcriptional regulator [Nocardia sp. FBN12]|uniref:TetR/AcrR family transcriptional regulator n=1 Tax=Nocardia sp. FBN12 TaxID=3419766 RepID=UPI003D017413
MARIESATGRYAGKPAAERRAERRTRLREAALEAFGAGPGYRNTRLIDLCLAAGLSTRQFYEEYDTLEDVLTELQLHINTAIEQRVVDETSRVEDLPLADRAAAMIRAFLSGITRDTRCARILFVEVVGVSERMDAQRLRQRSRWLDLLRELFGSFATRGEISRRDFDLPAATFVGLINGLMHDWTLGWVDATDDQLGEELLRMLVGSLGAAADVTARPKAAARSEVQRRPRNRRATILRAADVAFAERGYHRTSMADIASAVGITPAALYRHFRTKQELLGSCLREGLDVILARVGAAAGAETANGTLSELVRVALETRGLARLWQLEFRNLTESDRVGVLARSVRLTNYIGAGIERRRPDLTSNERELLSWIVLSVVTSPSNHRTQLPPDLFTRVLDGIVAAVIETSIPEGEPRLSDSATSETAHGKPDPQLRVEQMIVAAARLFNERGFGAVSMEDIGASVGVRGPALYHHFASKADLLDEIVERNNRCVQLCAERARTEADDARTSLQLVLRYYIDFAVGQPDLIGTAVGELGHLSDDAAARYRRTHRDGVMGWARLLQTVRPELTPATARVLIHAVATVINDAIRNPRLTRRVDLVDLLCVVCERIALADIEPRPPQHLID